VSDATRETYELVVSALEETPQGLALGDAGLHRLTASLAAVDGEARLDRLLGVVAAMEFVATREHAEGAYAGLLAIVLGVIERSTLTLDEQDAWARKVKKATGQSTATRVLSGLASGKRPDGTIPAGPGARFAALKKT
jgi:hypothetical protein